MDTYDTPPHGWTCFFCGETFKTVGGAQDHFGATPDKKPGCLLKVSVGAERGFVKPIVGARFPLERASDALELIDGRGATGKVVLDVRGG